MLKLYQFELSHYSEKVRLILDYKGLPYEPVEVVPGWGQWELYQRSGHRQVPVLQDGDTIVVDSTAIALYLDKTYPQNPILPSDPAQRSLCLLLEDWADGVLGVKARIALLAAFSDHPEFRGATLPEGLPRWLKQWAELLPLNWLTLAAQGELQAVRHELQEGLAALCLRLDTGDYLVGDRPSLADFAVAGLSFYLRFPKLSGGTLPLTLRDRSVPGFGDNPAYERFFQWRDRLYQTLYTPGDVA